MKAKDTNDTPLVSAIIAVFNGERYIAETINSALNQTHPNMEIIVVNDGSTDATSKELKPFLSNCRVKYLYQHNAGVGAARNRGIAISSGSYFAILDVGDVWLPEKTQKQLALFHSNPQLGLVYSHALPTVKSENGTWVIHEKMRSHYASRQVHRGRVFRQVVEDIFLMEPTTMIPRAVFDQAGGYSQDMRTEEGLVLHARIAHDYEIDFVSEPLVIIRRDPDGLSFNSNRDTQRLECLRRISNIYPECSIRHRSWMRSLYSKLAREQGYDAFYWGHMQRARRDLWQACKYAPTRLSNWGYLAASCLPSLALRMIRRLKRKFCGSDNQVNQTARTSDMGSDID
jgi:glycosyltransferase involved in cell wall biosynthesis